MNEFMMELKLCWHGIRNGNMRSCFKRGNRILILILIIDKSYRNFDVEKDTRTRIAFVARMSTAGFTWYLSYDNGVAFMAHCLQQGSLDAWRCCEFCSKTDRWQWSRLLGTDVCSRIHPTPAWWQRCLQEDSVDIDHALRWCLCLGDCGCLQLRMA